MKDFTPRVRRTTSCRDTDSIPKVENAGEVLRDEDGVEYQLMHNGVKVVYGGYHGDWMGEIIQSLRGHHEPQEEKVFYEILKHVPNGGTMIEAGCFWAYYSAWFQKAIEGAHNYLIEPHPDKIETGQKNFELNGMHGSFFEGFIGSTSKDNDVFVDWDDSRRTLRRIAIDDFLVDQGIGRVDILHADIQGAEVDLLAGCERSIAQGRIDFFVISTHGKVHDPCLEFLRTRGFSIIAAHTPQESASVDGLIAAHAPHIHGVPQVAISKLEPAWKMRAAAAAQG